MRRCNATGCKNDPKTWKLLPYLWNGHKFFKLGPLNWATCLLFLFWNCKIQVWGIKNKVLNLLPKLATARYSGFTSNTLGGGIRTCVRISSYAQDNMPTCDVHKFLNRTDSTKGRKVFDLPTFFDQRPKGPGRVNQWERGETLSCKFFPGPQQ